MSSDIQEYFVIFDTNVLYHAYDKKADFSSFSFNSTFENSIETYHSLITSKSLQLRCFQSC